MKKTPGKTKIVCLLLFCVLVSKAGSAQYRYKSALPAITQPGYHKITLTPAITAKAQADLSDIRIEDGTGNTVAYILKKESPLINAQELKEFILQPPSITPDSNTQIIMDISGPLKNIGKDARYSVILVMKTANAYREATLSGSNDLQNWFAVTDKLVLDAAGNGSGGETNQAVAMPATNYKYLRLLMKDKGIQPLQITKAGVLLGSNIYGQYAELPVPVVQQKDSSNHTSYITLQFDDQYPVDKLRFSIQQPALYKRRIALYDTTGGTRRMLAQTVLQPGMDSITLDRFKGRILLAEVENFDDQPLQIKEIRGYQLKQYLIASLLQQKPYYILTGNEKAIAPVYDLDYFANSIQVLPGELLPAAPDKLQNNNTPPKPASARTSTILMWVIIGIALITLLWLSSRLVKNMTQNKQL